MKEKTSGLNKGYFTPSQLNNGLGLDLGCCVAFSIKPITLSI